MSFGLKSPWFRLTAQFSDLLDAEDDDFLFDSQVVLEELLLAVDELGASRRGGNITEKESSSRIQLLVRKINMSI